MSNPLHANTCIVMLFSFKQTLYVVILIIYFYIVCLIYTERYVGKCVDATFMLKHKTLPMPLEPC